MSTAVLPTTAPQPSSLEGTRFIEDFESQHRYQPAATMDGAGHPAAATGGEAPKRPGTLKKKSSLRRIGSKRSRSGSVHSVQLDHGDRDSAFYTPVPTQSNPTEILVNRFQAWRKVLKDFITYFREVEVQYETRSRGMNKIIATLNGAAHPPEFLSSGGIMETHSVLRDFHQGVLTSTENAAKVGAEVVQNLTGLRSDLNLKIKEIKALSGDFKSGVEKEKEATKREVLKLQDALASTDLNATGAKDPYIVKLGVERQLRRHLKEENYLHRAYLNLESSGRELEKIVVSEIQKAYDTYVKITVREGQELLDLADRLVASTLRLPPDYEWTSFIERDHNMVDPSVPLRAIRDIEYPGHQHPAATEVMSGMLERKSKYLKSFTPAWYVLSSTHLHEFKSPDRTRDQSPVMSLYLPESTLGRHSGPNAVSHKFVLKGRQIGALHRGHSWVFRAETHEVMLEWYEAIKKLTEISGAERNEFVQRTSSHHRTAPSASPGAESSSSDNGLENDEADEIPYSGQNSVMLDTAAAGGADSRRNPREEEESPKRPEGGRFPSDFQVSRGLENRTPTDEYSNDAAVMAAANALPGTTLLGHGFDGRHSDGTFGESPYQRDASPDSHMENSYVVVPPMDQTRADASNSWYRDGEKEVNSDRQPQRDVTGDALDAPSAHTQHEQQEAASRGPLVTGHGIDPVTGEHESPVNQDTTAINEHQQQPGAAAARILMVTTEAYGNSREDDDPREPLPSAEVDFFALDPVQIDVLASQQEQQQQEGGERSPVTAEAVPLEARRMESAEGVVVVEGNVPADSGGGGGEGGVDYATRPGRGMERGDTESTIACLHVPGKFPKKT